MKKELFALSLFLSLNLVADYESEYLSPQREEKRTLFRSDDLPPLKFERETVEEPYSSSESDADASDESCYEPEPRCIPCESYSPAFYDPPCNRGEFFDAEFLYWYATESNLPIAMEVNSVPINATDFQTYPAQVHVLETNWDPGFRVGAGWNSRFDGWDLYLNWTWFRNKKTQTTSVDPTYFSSGFFTFGGVATSNVDIPSPGQSALINPWINTAFIQEGSIPFNTTTTFFNEPMLSFDTIKAKWSILINSFDLELGRKYWLSRYCTMRPYVGVRGAWTKTCFKLHSRRNFTPTVMVPATINRSYEDQFIDHQWGVGILAGFEPTFDLGCHFSIYGNFDASLIWGKSKDHKKMRYAESTRLIGTILQIGSNFASDTTSHYNQHFTMIPIVDLGLGLRWERTWCGDRYRSTIDLGWEQHVWFNFNHRYITNGSNTTLLVGSLLTTGQLATTFQSFDVLNTNLYYGGGVLRLRLDF